MNACISRKRLGLLALVVLALTMTIVGVAARRAPDSPVTIDLIGYATNQAGVRGLTYLVWNHTAIALSLQATLFGARGPDTFASLPPLGEGRVWLSVGSNPPPHQAIMLGYAPTSKLVTRVIQFLEKRRGRGQVDVSRKVFEIEPPAVME